MRTRRLLLRTVLKRGEVLTVARVGLVPKQTVAGGVVGPYTVTVVPTGDADEVETLFTANCELGDVPKALDEALATVDRLALRVAAENDEREGWARRVQSAVGRARVVLP